MGLTVFGYVGKGWSSASTLKRLSYSGVRPESAPYLIGDKDNQGMQTLHTPLYDYISQLACQSWMRLLSPFDSLLRRLRESLMINIQLRSIRRTLKKIPSTICHDIWSSWRSSQHGTDDLAFRHIPRRKHYCIFCQANDLIGVWDDCYSPGFKPIVASNIPSELPFFPSTENGDVEGSGYIWWTLEIH